MRHHYMPERDDWQKDDELVYDGIWYSVRLVLEPDTEDGGFWLWVADKDGAERCISSRYIDVRYERWVR